MAVDASQWAWRQDLGGRPTYKLVLVCLAHRQNQKTRLCCPSVATIAKDTGLGQTAVKAALNGLRELRLISSHQPAGHGGRRTSNRYRLHLDYELPHQASRRVREAEGRTLSAALRPTPSDALPWDAVAQPAAVLSRRDVTMASGRHATLEGGRVATANREEENKEEENKEEENKEEENKEEEMAPRSEVLASSEQRRAQPAPHAPWQGVAVKLDSGGWGLDASGEPLKAEVAADFDALDLYNAAVGRRAKEFHETNPSGGIRLISGSNLHVLKRHARFSSDDGL